MVGIPTMLSSFFLQPIGLLAATAIVPLIIFYLVKKKPEEEIMPSMMFFMEDKRSGKAKTAFRTLLRNLLLLLHILLVLGMSSAIAQPFIEMPGGDKETVVVFDKSASMANDIEQSKSFVKENLGQKNTLITVGENVRVPLERSSPGEVNRYIQNLESKDVETDIASALNIVSEYDGTAVLATDMDQTVNSRETTSIVETMRDNGREVKVYEPDNSNSWGIIDIRYSENNISADVKNFMDQQAEIEAQTNSETRNLNIEPGAVAPVSFSKKTGKNTVSLYEDGVPADNTAYVSVPENSNQKVLYIGDDRNPYLEKVFDLIEFTSFEYKSPPIDRQTDADIYILGPTNRVLSDTIEGIEQEVRGGDSLIVFSHSNVFNVGFSSLPVESTGTTRNRSVEITEPKRIDIGTTQVMDVNITEGERLTRETNALVRGTYGDGDVLFYNIDDRDFRLDFLYPVFWKHILKDMTDQPSINELNLKTGETIEASEIATPAGTTVEDEVQTEEIGFYEADHIYAINLLSEEESGTESIELKESETEPEKTERNIQNIFAALILLLLVGELGYLYRLGELE